MGICNLTKSLNPYYAEIQKDGTYSVFRHNAFTLGELVELHKGLERYEAMKMADKYNNEFFRKYARA